MKDQSKIKIAFFISNQIMSRKSSKRILETYPHTSPEDADVFVVIGGDGFLLHTIHENLHHNKPIFGLNRGSVGFLMNRFSEQDLIQRIQHAQTITLHPLKMSVTTIEGEKKEALAFNEVSLRRSSRLSAKVRVFVDDVMRLQELMADGILLSTPAGSTAYNLSAHGPILPLNSNLLALTPINAFRPRQWRGALIPHTATVNFEVLHPKERPLCVETDNTAISNIQSVNIQEDRTTSVQLLFDEEDLYERVLSEQFKT